MHMLYFLGVISIIIFIILKRTIVRNKRKTKQIKPVAIVKDKDTTIYVKPDNVPFLYYSNFNSKTLKIIKKGEEININTIFYIEEGSVSIKHKKKLICTKSANDFHFYTLGFINKQISDLQIIANEDTKIWIVSLQYLHKFITMCSLKKKVVDVLSDYLNLSKILVKTEILFLNKNEENWGLNKFVNQFLKINFDDFRYKILRLNESEIYKKKYSCLTDLLLVEEGELLVNCGTEFYKLKKGSIFGYSSLFFKCYWDSEITSLTTTRLKIISSDDLRKNGLSLQNFNFSFFEKIDDLVHYIDLCSDWRIFRKYEQISSDNLIYINEGLSKKNSDKNNQKSIYFINKLSDVIIIKNYVIELALEYDVKLHKSLFSKSLVQKNNKIVTLISTDDSVDISLFCRRLQNSVGKSNIILDKKNFFFTFDLSDELRISDYLNSLSRANELVLINIENKYSRLAKFVCEISDVVLVVGYQFKLDTKGQVCDLDKFKNGNFEYVKLYEDCQEKNTIYSGMKFHHVLSPTKTILFSTKDYERLGRYLLDKRVGLVLSGGGARGIAHVGVIQALEEENIPIDIIGGTSMGAYVGALYCKGRDNSYVFKETKKFSKKVRNIFNILFDITVPLMSFFKGSAINHALKKVFKTSLIQDLWVDYFCVTTNLFTNDEEVHTTGLLWKYLRASMGLCGYLPPVVDEKGFLVDGGYINNVPIDIMLKMNVYKVIAVDVGTLQDNDFDKHEECFNGLVGLIHKLLGVRKYMTMGEIQYRLAFLTSQKKLQEFEKNENVFLIRPNLRNIKTMDFAKFDDIVASGYVCGKQFINKWKEDGTFARHFNFRKKRLLRRRYSV